MNYNSGQQPYNLDYQVLKHRTRVRVSLSIIKACLNPTKKPIPLNNVSHKLRRCFAHASAFSIDGPLVYLCHKYGVTGHGITVSPMSIPVAEARAAKYGVDATFEVSHWKNLPEMETYDVIFTDETIVHFYHLGNLILSVELSAVLLVLLVLGITYEKKSF